MGFVPGQVVVPRGDVVEAGGVAGSLPDRIKGGIDEGDGGHPRRLGLLVGEGQETGPKGGGRAGAHHRIVGIVVVAGVALVGRDEIVVRVHRNVGNVALDRGPAVGGHIQGLLVAGDRHPRTNAAAAREGGPAEGLIPGGFGNVARPVHPQFGPSHHRHLDLGKKVDGRRHGGGRVARHVGPIVPRGLEEGLPLGGELLEDQGGGGIPEAGPGTTDLLGLVVGGHLVQHQVRGGCPVGFLINHHLAQARSHGNHHFNVQGNLHDAVRIGGVELEPVHRDVQEGHIGQSRQAFIALDVRCVIALELHQGHGLPGAGQANAGGIGVAEVGPPKKPAGGRTRRQGGRRGGRVHRRRGRGESGRRDFEEMMDILDMGHGPGPLQVVQAADMRQGHIQVQGRFVFGGVGLAAVRAPVPGQADVQGALHLCRGARNFQEDPVGGSPQDVQFFRTGEGHDRLVVRLAGPVIFGELLGREVMAVKGALGVVDLFQEILEFPGMTPGQGDRQVQHLGVVQGPQPRQDGSLGRDVALQLLASGSPGGGGKPAGQGDPSANDPESSHHNRL